MGISAISGGGWDGAWKAGLVGAASGAFAATGGFGMAKAWGSTSSLSVGSGFFTGAVVGASGGFVGGFTGGLGNGLLGGQSFGNSLVSGLKDGGIGAISGGAIGGIAAGIQAARQGTNFWTGEGGYGYEATGSAIAGDPVEYSNSSAAEFSSSHEGLNRLSANVDNLYADGRVPSGFHSDDAGHFIKNGGKANTYGWTERTGIFRKTTSVYLAKATFVSREQLYLVMHHEYMHAYFFVNGLSLSNDGHDVIHGWERNQIQAWAPYRLTFDPSRNYFSYGFSDSYLKYGFKIINNRP